MANSLWLFHIQMKQTPHTRPSIFRPFPSAGVLRYVKTQDNYHSYLSSSHTSLYCPAGAQSTWSWWRQRCVHALWSFSCRVDCFCGSAWELLWQSPHCLLALLKGSCGWGGACSTWAASYLCLWLCYTASLGTVAISSLILYAQNLYATKRHKRALHQSLPSSTASCRITQKLLQPLAENWFLHRVSAVNGCSCASSTAGDNAAPWIAFKA